MKRLFCLLAAVALLAGCSVTDEVATEPVIHGASPAPSQVNDTIGLPGDIKPVLPGVPIKIVATACGTQSNVYTITVRLALRVKQSGKLVVSLGIRQQNTSDYRWSVDESIVNMSPNIVPWSKNFVIETPATDDVYLKLVAVGGDEQRNNSNQHYTEYTPGGGDNPSIPSTQCAMAP